VAPAGVAVCCFPAETRVSSRAFGAAARLGGFGFAARVGRLSPAPAFSVPAVAGPDGATVGAGALVGGRVAGTIATGGSGACDG